MSTFDLTGLPTYMATKFSIDLLAAQVLMSVILLSLFLFPTMFLSKRIYPTIFVGIGALGFCVAVGWLPIYLFFLISLITAALVMGKFRDVLT